MSNPETNNSLVSAVPSGRQKWSRPLVHVDAAKAPSSSPALSLSDALTAARRWWWQCTLVGSLLGSIAASVVWMLFSPVYMASAWLEVKDQRPHVVFPASPDSKAFAETQLQTIQSPVVLMRVASQPEIAALRESPAKTTLEWLEKGLKAKFLGRSELCSISFSSFSASSSMKVANAILDAYLSLHQDSYGEQVERIVELLVDEREHRKAEVEELRERVRVLTKKTAAQDGTAPSTSTSPVLLRENPLITLEAHRTEAEVDRLVSQAELQAYREADTGSSISEGEVDHATASSPEIGRLKQELALKRTSYQEHLKKSSRGVEDPLRKKYERDLDHLEKTIVELGKQLRPRVIAELKAAYAARRDQTLADLETQVKKHGLLEELWKNRIEEHRGKTLAVSEDSLELEFARQELERAEDVFEKIGDRLIVLKTEKRAPPQAIALQRAVTPDTPLEEIPYKRLSMAFFGAFCLPFGLALVWERSLRRISDSQDLLTRGGPPLVGEIAALPSRPALASKEGRVARDRLTFEESVDALCVSLLLSDQFQRVQTVAVTSSVSREGKTSLASSLAMSLARCTRETTLLVDADLRAPDLHEVFNAALQPGLVDALEKRTDVEQAIVRDVVHGIDLLPAGQLSRSVHATLCNEDLQSIFAELRKKYRYIVVDAPPVLVASEALLIAASADGALVCAMRDVSRAAQFQLTCKKLSLAGAYLLGTVMSGIPTRAWAQKYGGYGYGWERYSSRQHTDE